MNPCLRSWLLVTTEPLLTALDIRRARVWFCPGIKLGVRFERSRQLPKVTAVPRAPFPDAAAAPRMEPELQTNLKIVCN